MKYLKISSLALLLAINVHGYNATLMYHLQAIQTNYIFEKNEAYGQTIKKAFQAFHKISKTAGPMVLLQQSNITNLFLLSPVKNNDLQFNESLKNIQNIMLVHIYAKIFQEYKIQTQDLIKHALNSLQYWETEKFYDKLPMLRKHPVYWYHSPQHKKTVCKHAQALKDLIDQATLLLGIALHGQHQLLKIQDISDLAPKLLQATEPLSKHFQTIQLPDADESEALFQNTVWLHQNILLVLQNHQKILQQHEKPHHIVRHAFGYSCITLATIATYILYQTHKADMPMYQEKTIEVWNYFVKEYVRIPLQKLKETLWDKKILQIQKMGELDPLQPSEPITARIQAQPFKIPMIRFPVEIPEITVTIPPTEINGIKATLNQNKSEIRSCLNANADIISELSRDQQLNLAMAAIAPTILAAFGAYYSGKSLYNKYIKHETWYRPMQLIVREIDKILNKLTAENTIFFADDGMLYVLTRELKTYISCLPNEELEMIEQDLKELSAYHLSYQQKRGVIDRMYRTYQFLKYT